MEKLDIWIQLAIAIFSLLSGPPFIQLILSYQRRRLKNLLNAVEAKDLIEKCSEDFKSNFVMIDFQENYFFAQTGIKTNQKSIACYIQLKDKLGNDFTWEPIRIAKPYLKLKSGKIKVVISKWERLYKNAVLIYGFGLFLVGIGIGLYLNQYDQRTVTDTLQVLFLVITPMIFGYLALTSVQSLISASNIEKRLEELKASKKA